MKFHNCNHTTGHPLSKIFELFTPQKCREEVECYKKLLYKFGKEKRCSPVDLYDCAVQGFYTASSQAQLIQMRHVTDQKLFKEFKNDSENFAKTAEKFSKIMGNDFVESEKWRKCHQNFGKYLRGLPSL